jgi:hypothetical protein
VFSSIFQHTAGIHFSGADSTRRRLIRRDKEIDAFKDVRRPTQKQQKRRSRNV